MIFFFCDRKLPFSDLISPLWAPLPSPHFEKSGYVPWGCLKHVLTYPVYICRWMVSCYHNSYHPNIHQMLWQRIPHHWAHLVPTWWRSKASYQPSDKFLIPKYLKRNKIVKQNELIKDEAIINILIIGNIGLWSSKTCMVSTGNDANVHCIRCSIKTLKVARLAKSMI